MKKQKQAALFTVTHTRKEVYYFLRHLENKRDMAINKLQTLYPVGKVLTPTQELEEQGLKKYRDQLQEFTQLLSDRLSTNDAQKLKLMAIREELEEIIDLLPDSEEEALKAAKKAYRELPQEESINLSYDRTTLKFILKIVSEDLQKFRDTIIPNYEKANPTEFQNDILRPKAFWVAKSRKSKNFLENLKKELEKGL